MLSRLAGTRVAGYLAIAVVGTLVGAGGLAFAASGGGTINACANKRTGALRLAAKCKKKETAVVWNVQGPQGTRGPQGTQGPQGTPGANGTNGTNGTNAATNVTQRVGNAVPVANGASGTATVSCNPGEKATGGGSTIAGGSGWSIVETFALTTAGTPTGWRVDATNNTGSTANLFAVVICVSP